MKQRIRYFDLAKGFLMILVVLHHIHMHGAKYWETYRYRSFWIMLMIIGLCGLCLHSL